MNVFEATLANGYEMINFKTYEDGSICSDLDGSPRKGNWTPPHVQRDRPTRRSACKAADLPFGLNTLFMRRPAMEALRDVLEAYGEILPVIDKDGVELFVHNVLGIREALDMERSDIVHVPETTIVYIRTPVFIESAIGDAEMFRVPIDTNRVFYTDRFVERVKAAKLKGTDFVKRWSSP
jgi:hypothetical protein